MSSNTDAHSPGYQHHHQHTDDTFPPPPTSPIPTTALPHPRPQTQAQTTTTPSHDTTGSSQLRHRSPHSHADSSESNDLIRVSVQTPLGDSGHRSRRKEGYPLLRTKTVAELKEDLVAGRLEGAGWWEEDGMRLVYHGRILRDHETLGDIVGKSTDTEHVYVLHLVARRIPTTPIPLASEHVPQFPFINHLPNQPETAFHATSTPSLSPTTSVNSLALSDTIHYLLFTSRHHLFHLLNLEPLQWDKTVPPPIVPQDKAREAVMSVVRAFADQRSGADDGWEGWEAAFEGDTEESLKSMWQKAGKDGLESAIKAAWAIATGRSWAEEGEETVEVEVDGSNYSLALPRLQQLAPSQLAHLLVYLRICSILPMLNVLLHQSLLPSPASPRSPASAAASTPQPIPTPTQPLPDARVLYRRTFRLRLPLIPFPILSSLFFSAIRMSVMVWMLTRGMKSYDVRSAIIIGVAGAWWTYDALRQLRQHAREVRARMPIADAAAAENLQGGQNQAQGRGEARGGDGNGAPAAAAPQAAQAGAGAGNQNRRPRRANQNTVNLNRFIPLFHLDTDAAQLRLPPTSLNSPAQLARPVPAHSRPMRIVTQFLLPVVLWFVTLVPEWEAVRARAIRRRESTMRVLVNEMQPGRSAPGNVTQAEAGLEGFGEPREGQSQGQEQEQAQTHTQAPAPLRLPDDLSEPAKRYYQRVMDRGEGIDWEEEREAQRAMGVGEEQEEGDGMRLRML